MKFVKENKKGGKMKKFLYYITAVIVAVCSFSFLGCNGDNNQGSGGGAGNELTNVDNIKAQTIATANDFNYTESGGKITIQSLKNESLTSFEIPSKIDGKDVTTIASQAFGKQQTPNETITFIRLPSTITTINTLAFVNCYALKNIDLNEGITTIGISAFMNCKALEQINLPNSLTELSQYAFSSCESMKKVKFPTNLTKIGDNCFANCYKLNNVILPSTVTTLGEKVFQSCAQLTNIVLPAGVTMGANVFMSDVNLKTIYYLGTSAQWNSTTNRPTSSGITVLYYSNSQTTGGWRYVNNVPTAW